MNARSESKGGNRIYVWIIATSTLMLIGLFLWPLSVSEFRTTSVFSLRYQPTSGIEKTALNSWVVDALRQQTDRVAISDMFTQLETTMSSSILNSLDPEVIRQAIHIQGRPGNTANSVEYQLSIIGDGSADEIEFINMVVSRINSQLDKQLTRDNDVRVLATLTNDLARFYDGQLEQVSGQLSGILDNLSTAENDIRIVASDLQGVTNNSFAAPETANRSVLGRPTADALENLYAEKQRLLNQPGMTEYHPQVASIQREIETLKGDLPNIRTSTVSVNGQPANQGFARNSKVIKNPYAQASATTSTSYPSTKQNELQTDDLLNLDAEPGQETFVAPIDDILQGIEMIDLSPSRQALNDVQETIENFEASEGLVSRLTEQATFELQADSPISLAGFEMARRGTPIGGAPNVTQFMMLLMMAGLFGTFVTLNYDPSLKKTPFRSVEQLQRKLSVPVIGVLRSQSLETPRPFNKRAAARVIQICEWTLLALAVLLIIAALANSEVAAAFMENPFHGITKTIWLLSPNH